MVEAKSTNAVSVLAILRGAPDPLMRSWPTLAKDAADEIERLGKIEVAARKVVRWLEQTEASRTTYIELVHALELKS